MRLGHGMDTIDNGADTLDSREIIERIEYLESLEEAAKEAEEELMPYQLHAGENAPTDDETETIAKLEAEVAATKMDEVEAAELAALRALESEAEGYCPDWRHGATLIRYDCFEDHAREMADGLHGDRWVNPPWPFDCINWEEAARQLAQDYTTVDFDGVEYLVR